MVYDPDDDNPSARMEKVLEETGKQQSKPKFMIKKTWYFDFDTLIERIIKKVRGGTQ